MCGALPAPAPRSTTRARPFRATGCSTNTPSAAAADLITESVLFDGLLVKDNHVAAVHIKELGAHLSRVVTTCRAEDPSRVVEIEVDTLEQLREVIKVEGINVILLDNMELPEDGDGG